MNVFRLSVCWLALLSVCSARGFVPPASLTVPKMWRSANGETLPYRLHLPSNAVAGVRYPLVVHMHGAGSRGTNNLAQVGTGAAQFMNWANDNGREYILVAPQCPSGRQWVDTPWQSHAHRMADEPTPYLRMALEIVDDAVARYPVDPDRVYVMGISMGGYAAWELLQRRPKMFAAALPCCGGGDTMLASNLTDVAIWAFHGDKDDTVPTYRSRSMVAAIRAAGGRKVRYREYPGVDHNSWTPTFSDHKVFEWFFSRRRGTVAPCDAVAEAQAQVAEGLISGAVFARGDGGSVGVAGEAAPGKPMTEKTCFDLASVTKTFTAAAAALLVAEGKLDAAKLHALATHTTTGRFKYDCANFVALGQEVERASGMRLDRFCRERIFRPLGMKRTGWWPIADDGTLCQMLPAGTPPGVVSDLRARASNRAIGNAGAFSDIRDMRLFVTDLLKRQKFPKAYYDLLFTCRYEEAGGIRRSFGFDMSDATRPAGLSRAAIFHSGWTGQTIAVDPETGFCGVVLTARTGDHDRAIEERKRILAALARESLTGQPKKESK